MAHISRNNSRPENLPNIGNLSNRLNRSSVPQRQPTTNRTLSEFLSQGPSRIPPQGLPQLPPNLQLPQRTTTPTGFSRVDPTIDPGILRQSRVPNRDPGIVRQPQPRNLPNIPTDRFSLGNFKERILRFMQTLTSR